MKKKKPSSSQTSLESFFQKEKSSGPREIMLEIGKREGPEGFEKFKYTSTKKALQFPITRRNRIILEHLDDKPLTVQELSTLMNFESRTIYVELKFLEMYGLVKRR